jgi:2-hydroxy-6-oxonona-2,4-dienedioate hydrolase
MKGPAIPAVDGVAAEGFLHSVYDVVGGLRVHGLASRREVAPRVTQAPLVFVHGLGVSLRYLEPTMERLAGEFDVDGIDLPGFGGSDTPPKALDVPALASVLGAWLDARRIGPAIFVGNSFGCQVIVELVARQPERAVGLVLNAPTIDPAHRSKLAMILRVARDVPNEPLRLTLIVARDYLRAGPRRILKTLDYAIADRIEEKLPSIMVPTLVVCGAHDPVVTVGWASEVTRLVGIERADAAGAMMQCVGDAAHALPFDDPAAFAAIVRNFAGGVTHRDRGVSAAAPAR